MTNSWTDLVDRGSGPFHFRFILQPTVAVLLGIRDGLKYGRERRSFLLWAGPEDPLERRAQFAATWRSIGKVFVLAVILDTLYQIIVLSWFYPLQTIIVAFSVALIPYLAVRGLVNAVARGWRGRKPPDQTTERNT